MKLEETKLSSTEIFDGVAIHLYRDEILLPNGNKGVREVIRHPGAVCVIPITEDGDVIFVNQFRYAFNKVTLEIPAGKLNPGENHYECGLRELEEETGCKTDNYRYLGCMYPTPAYCSEIIHMYLATELSKGEQKLDEDEFVDVEKMPLSDAVKEIMNGNITDGKTQTAILKAYIYLNK